MWAKLQSNVARCAFGLLPRLLSLLSWRFRRLLCLSRETIARYLLCLVQSAECRACLMLLLCFCCSHEKTKRKSEFSESYRRMYHNASGDVTAAGCLHGIITVLHHWCRCTRISKIMYFTRSKQQAFQTRE